MDNIKLLEARLVYSPLTYGFKKPYWLFNWHHNPSDENSIRVFGKFETRTEAEAWLQEHGGYISHSATDKQWQVAFEVCFLPSFYHRPIPSTLGMHLINDKDSSFF